MAVSPQDLVYAQLATSVANPTAPDPFAGLRSYQDCKLACTRAGGGIDEACMTSCFAAVIAGLMRPASSAAEDPVKACIGSCYQRFGLTCIPALEGTPLECACIKGCRQAGGKAGADLGSLVPVLLLAAAALVILVLIVR